MNLNAFGIDAILTFSARSESDEYGFEPSVSAEGVYEYDNGGLLVRFEINKEYRYKLSVISSKPISVSMGLCPTEKADAWHLIPCNIHGDNNLKKAKPGYFPNLTYEYPEFETSSDEWEFRSDRASHPVSIVHNGSMAYGISINPYTTDSDGNHICNGLFSKLPSTAGVSLGYRNYPHTFTFKEMFDKPTFNTVEKATAVGKIFTVKGNRVDSVSHILKDLYEDLRECPEPNYDIGYYLKAFMDSYENINWSENLQAFTNMECKVPGDPQLKPWRPLIATGWTGTGVVSYPLMLTRKLLQFDNKFSKKLEDQFNSVVAGINPSTGMFYDLIQERNGSRYNGWWAGYMVSDCHCAYTNGNGVYYLLKAYLLLKEKGIEKQEWLESAMSVVDAANKIQLADGNYGYTYSTEKPAVIDKEGFAGCWFAAASALMYSITTEEKYLEKADKAIRFYYEYVKNLDCWGTPMDTWKSIDQEGNLAFVRTAALLHRNTGNHEYLKMLIDGAHYEYLWRYSYKAKPLYPPLKDSPWNSCGGSVTSVSNPHIHPMGVNITADLIYLYKMTGDMYHLKRAEDGLCWGLATSDMYPDITGYGQPGVITERWCPSDGLVIEKYSDTGNPSSIWFTFNGWAGASIFEGLAESTALIKEYEENTNSIEIHDIFKLIQRKTEI